MILPILSEEDARALVGFSLKRWSQALRDGFIKPELDGQFHIITTVHGALEYENAKWNARIQRRVAHRGKHHG